MEERKRSKPLTDFFDNLASFDTETTGTNAKVDRIWQVGFTGKGIDTEEVVNPFYRFNNDQNVFEPERLSIVDFHEKVIGMNGDFSRKAFERGDFTELLHQHHLPPTIGQGINSLSYSLSDTLDKTLGNLKTSDILVLQNHNFENKLLQQGYNDGILSTDTYNRIKDKLEYISVDGSTNNPTGLLQLPPEVERASRRASTIYRTQYLNAREGHKSIFKSYTRSLNTMMDHYKTAINNPNRKAIVVEQMDITKALYANAIDRGYLDKSHAQIGLKMDFLTNVLLDRAEKHTALSDSKDTLEVFKKTWNMTEELRTGNVSEGTKKLLVKINEAQYKEAHSQFMDTVASVAKDFQERGHTYYSSSSGIRLPNKDIKNTVTNDVTSLSSRGGYKKPGSNITADFATAMDSVLSNYSAHGNSDLREKLVSQVKSAYIDGGAKKAYELAESTKNTFKLDELPLVKNVSTHPDWWKEPTEFLGKEMSRGVKAGIIGGGVALLGYMALKRSPQKQEENSYVSQQFYDEQYLGTEFVNFNNRNKHYMY